MAIALSTLRKDAYSAIRGYVDGNKITGSTVINSYPESDPTFPCYILPMQDVSIEQAATLDGSKREYLITASLDVVATRNQGQVKITEMLDSVLVAFDNVDLSANNLMFETMDSSEIARIEVNEEKLYTAGVILTFTLTA